MLKTRNFVPSVYFNTSRDFQLIGNLFDLVLNAIKTDADLVFNLPFSINSDDQLLDLLTYTFGLRIDCSKYTSKQLRAVCHAAPVMMKNKGSRLAVEALCRALLRVDGIEEDFSLEVDPETHTLYIAISQYASCTNLIEEILPYIVPAGLDFNIGTKYSEKAPNITTPMGMVESVAYSIVDSRNSENKLPTTAVVKQIDKVVTSEDTVTLTPAVGNFNYYNIRKQDGNTLKGGQQNE